MVASADGAAAGAGALGGSTLMGATSRQNDRHGLAPPHSGHVIVHVLASIAATRLAHRFAGCDHPHITHSLSTRYAARA